MMFAYFCLCALHGIFWWSLTQQQLWRSVPECDHAVGVAVPLAVFSQAEGSSQTKVSQLQDTVSGNEHVGCFHVSVKDLTQENTIL